MVTGAFAGHPRAVGTDPSQWLGVDALAAGLRTRGYDVAVHAGPPDSEAFAQRWGQDRPDVVHAHGWTQSLAALAAARPVGVPVVASLHRVQRTAIRSGPDPEQRLQRAVCHEACAVLATCTSERDHLLRIGVPRHLVSVVPCGVDTHVFSPVGPVADRDSRPRLLTAGRLLARKGFDTAIRALHRIPEAELVIAAAVEDRVDERWADELRRLRQLASRLGIAERVHLVGAVPHADMPALFRSADAVLCVPSHGRFCLVALEAMACGVPVVGTPVGGLPDMIVPGSTGDLVPARRADALAAVVRRLLADPFRREAYSIAALDRARSRYRWSRIAQDTAALYEQAHQRARAGQPA